LKAKSSNILSWVIITIIALVYFIFASIALELSKRATIETLRTDALREARAQSSELGSELQKFSLVPIILRENPDVLAALSVGSNSNIEKLNFKLKSLTEQTHATYIYAIDKSGRTIASSNFDLPDSFVGRDYRFRPYFLRAMQDGESKYYAKGQTTGRAGLFLAGRISNAGEALGVIVVKVEFNDIAERWSNPASTSFVVNQDGIILFSSDMALNFKTLKPLTPAREVEIMEARQFGIILLVGVALFSLMLIYRRRRQKETEKAAVTELLKSEVARQTKELSETNEKLEHEIGQRESVNLRFRAAREELAQANRLGSVGAITASVAHELNQPVSAIRTYAENANKFLSRGNSCRTRSLGAGFCKPINQRH